MLFEQDLILIPKTKNGDPVAIPMNAMVKETLLRVVGERRTGYVFIDEAGNPYTGGKISAAFKRACKKACIEDLHLHDNRHHFASSLVQSGVDLYRVQKLLGHKDLRMTQRYAHLVPRNLKDAVSVLETDTSATNLLQSGKTKGVTLL